jgi:hypothetical protein
MEVDHSVQATHFAYGQIAELWQNLQALSRLNESITTGKTG